MHTDFATKTHFRNIGFILLIGLFGLFIQLDFSVNFN